MMNAGQGGGQIDLNDSADPEVVAPESFQICVDKLTLIIQSMSTSDLLGWQLQKEGRTKKPMLLWFYDHHLQFMKSSALMFCSF